MHNTIFTLLLAPAPRETHAKACAPRGAVQPSCLGVAETWMWLSLLLALSENPSKLLFSSPFFGNRLPPSQLALKATGLQGQDELPGGTGAGQSSYPAQGAAWNWSHARTDHDDVLWMYPAPPERHTIQSHENKPKGRFVSVFSFWVWMGGWGRRKYCFDEEKRAENLDLKVLSFLFFYYTQVHHMRSPSKPQFMWHPVVPFLKQLKTL